MDIWLTSAEPGQGRVILVSNEVGMGIVPDNMLARTFRDVAGRANQKLAAAADEIYLCVSGIPMKVKHAAPASNVKPLRRHTSP